MKEKKHEDKMSPCEAIKYYMDAMTEGPKTWVDNQAIGNSAGTATTTGCNSIPLGNVPLDVEAELVKFLQAEIDNHNPLSGRGYQEKLIPISDDRFKDKNFDVNKLIPISDDRFKDVTISPYHLVPIKKGVLGELSKIQEELDELKDAENQGNKILINIELADLYGALEFYAEKQGLKMGDLKVFSDLTKKVKNNEKK